ncbi:DNA/RNA non-specific endonuclease [Yoonia sp.]|uniref:DNA/RNA non-specific endonuclease n=1 Tax=Yoonia sp. TaxID=2212373 RepID=UPI003266064E
MIPGLRHWDFSNKINRQADGGGGPGLLEEVRAFVVGQNNIDMTTREFLLHRDHELAEHMAARIREYEAMITVIGWATGMVTPPPPLTSAGVRQQIQDALSEMTQSLIERSQREGWEHLNPLNAGATAVGVLYDVSGGIAWLIGATETAERYDDISDAAYSVDVWDLYANAVNDIVSAIMDGLAQYWTEFWQEVDTNGFLIAYNKLLIDGGFLAAELGIDIALSALSGGVGGAASKVIRVTGRRISGNATEVTLKIGDAGDTIPDGNTVFRHVVDDADISDDVDRLMDEDSLGGAGPLDDTAARLDERPNGATTTVVHGNSRGANDVSWEVGENGRPISATATLREDFGGTTRGDEATALAVGRSGSDGDHGGHLVAHRFLGDTPAHGMVPQAGNLNQGAWKRMENEWADWLNKYRPAEGNRVEIDLVIDTDPPGAARPDTLFADYTVFEVSPDGTRQPIYRNEHEFQNEAGQTYERVRFRNDGTIEGS